MGKVNNEYVAALISSSSMDSYGTILEILRKRDEFVENGSKESVGDDYPGITAEHLEAISRNSQADIGNLLRLEALLSAKAQASSAPEQEAVGVWLKSKDHAVYPDICILGNPADIVEGAFDTKIPLYTHADDGEVEQLRADLKTERLRADAAVGDANEAERKLAEAQALLQRGVLVGRSELSIVRAALKRDAEERGMPVRAEILADLDSSIERFDTLISATAQPAEVKS